MQPQPPGSPVPLFVGLAATAVGAIGLLLTAAAAATITVLIASGAGTTTDPAGDALAPGLLAGIDAVACLGLLVSIALAVGGRDAGRSACVWLAGVTLPWVLVTAVFFALGVDQVDNGRAGQAAAAGVAGAGIAALGMLVGAVLLGIRPGRRWLAHRVLAAAARADAQTALTGVPPNPRQAAPLRAAWTRYRAAFLVVGAAGVGLLGLMPLSGMSADSGLAETCVAVAVLHVVLVSAPLVVAGLGARSGRRLLVRAFSVAPLLVLTGFVAMSAFVGVASAHNTDPDTGESVGVLPPFVSVASSGLLTVAFLAGIGLVVAGLAALADPRVTGGRVTRG